MLAFLGRHPSGVSLQELAAGLGIPKPSLHRILTAMRARGFATQLEPGGVYLLGSAALEAAFTFHSGFDMRQLLRPLVRGIRDRFQQTAHLGCLIGGEVSYIDILEANIGVRITSVIGGRNPAHATGLGKAMLARLLPGADSVREWVDTHGPLKARTPHTVTTVDALDSALEAVRERGFAIDNEESEPGVVCVAACVPMVFGDLSPIAAVSVTGLREPMLAIGVEQIGAELTHMITTTDFATSGKTGQA
nr:Transcriptional regulator, IclR family [Kibdelosporangium sp. MJ126-NF4]CTQ88482.1 Transcriptional regulator, IclR family [Kibdelosporangium sp. MJ126-NF4]